MWRITRHIQEHVGEDDLVLDVTCGRCAPTKEIKARMKVGVDIYRPALDIARDYCLPLNMDVRDLSKVFLPKTFDVALWLAGIEHLEATESCLVLEAIESIARKSVILHVPAEFFPNTHSEEYKVEGDPQRHKSFFPFGFYMKRGYTLIRRYGASTPEKHPSWLFKKEVG